MKDKIKILGAVSILLTLATIVLVIKCVSSTNEVKNLKVQINNMYDNEDKIWEEKNEIEKEISKLNISLKYQSKNLEKYKALLSDKQNDNEAIINEMNKLIESSNVTIDRLNTEIKVLKENLDKDKSINTKVQKDYDELNNLYKQQNKMMKNEHESLKQIISHIDNKVIELKKENNDESIQVLEKVKSDIELILTN